MSTPPLPPGDGHPERQPDPGARLQPEEVPPALEDAADRFIAANAGLTDDAPTVISRLPPRPASSEDVFSGTLRGRRLAHFELIEPIGVGGMAAVIRARDLQLERQVALKILPPEMAADAENVQRFHQEARAAAKLDHENIARVFFCGEDQKLHFIAFEFVEGMNLRSLIERRGPLPVAEAIRYMLQVATGLAHASERGVIHRDIKPSNIIISPHGRAKLVDMGLARQLDLHRDQGLTQSGVTLGTFDYISPEQALEPRDADVRSDIYSLGCTFYHALTGQPPVPEGTAARKLHHHQQIAPVDPRQLNPDIPDEVAAILARMMAKDPKDRYQRPEHLVQHLMQVAHKLGASAEVPEGVLFVDAPLPSPPRPRPVLTAVLAALALVGLVVLLGQATPRTSPTNRSARIEDRGAKVEDRDRPSPLPQHPDNTTPPADPPNRTPGEPLAAQTTVARTENPVYDADMPQPRDIVDFLERVSSEHRKSGAPPAQVQIRLAANVDLESLGPSGPDLVFDGGERSTLVIEPKDPTKPKPIIRMAFSAKRQPAPPVWAALTVKSGTVKLHGLCFVVNAEESPESAMGAVWRQGGRVEIDNCVFLQDHPSQDGRSRLSAIEVKGPAPRDNSAVSCRRCCFLSGSSPDAARSAVAGQNAVTLTESGGVDLVDCAFGPHAAVVALQGAGGRALPLTGARVTLQHCTALLAGTSAVARLENTQDSLLRVADCLFSQPGKGAPEADPAAVLIRQIDAGSLTWEGSGSNRYHNLDAFWMRPAERDTITTLDAFKGETGVQDSNAQVVSAWPWKSDEPLALLTGLQPAQLREAFQVKANLKDLRQGDSPNTRLVGVENLAWSDEPYNSALPPLKPAPAVARNARIVDPAPDARGANVYSTLDEALRQARPGDVLLLRWNGLRDTPPLRLNKSGLDVTLKPYDDYHPALTLASDTDDEEAALFRLHDGKLHLEGLEFVLHPANGQFKSQTVVAALGEGECTFKDCLVTLEQAYDVRLAAVTLADLAGVMKSAARPSGQRASFTFHNCFVRGDGDLVAARAGRPFDLEADNVLVALGGSLLNREAADGAADAPADTADGVRLSHVTAYLGGNLVRLHAHDTRALVPAKFKPVSDCLFVSAGGKALVHLDGAEANDDRLKALLDWDGRHNAYAKFPQLLDQQPDGGAMPAMPYNGDKWKEFAHETDAVFDRVKLDNPPPADASLAGLTVSRFRVKPDEMRSPDMQGYGADLDALPRTSIPADTATTPPDE
jgi:serine/threonine protein kinase